jgi:hypothetical protein
MRGARALARAGNARVRRGMIQLAWRFLRFQKERALALWYRARTADSRIGTRKTMIVALPRKLVIAPPHRANQETVEKAVVLNEIARITVSLGVTETRRAADLDTRPTIGIQAIMREAADTRSYAAALPVLVVAEWLYLDWASRAPPAAEQLRTRGVDHAARQFEFSWVRRFPAHEVGRVGPAHSRSVSRLLFSRCRARTLPF